MFIWAVIKPYFNLQELPGHLIALKDEKRLAAFLSDWEMFDELYDEEFSTKLIRFWTKVCQNILYEYILLE